MMVRLLLLKRKDTQTSFLLAGIVLFFLGLFTALNSSAFANSEAQESTSLTSVNQRLKVVSTIKPIQLLVNDIVGQYAESILLIPPTANLHHYSLRPSDLRKLSDADVVVRVSERLEHFLTDILKQKKQVLSLADMPEIAWLPIRDKHHEHESAHAHDSHDVQRDEHFWLDPRHAVLLVDYIVGKLSSLDPSHAKDYVQNGQQLKQRIQAASLEAETKLTPFRASRHLVFHDSWHYFEHRYGLAEPYVVSFQEGLPAGVKTVRRLRQRIKDEGIRCLIASPNSNRKVIKTLTENLAINTVWLSPLGASQSFESYAEYIRYTTEQFSACMRGVKVKPRRRG